jgi:hypothetical protein
MCTIECETHREKPGNGSLLSPQEVSKKVKKGTPKRPFGVKAEATQRSALAAASAVMFSTRRTVAAGVRM